MGEKNQNFITNTLVFLLICAIAKIKEAKQETVLLRRICISRILVSLLLILLNVILINDTLTFTLNFKLLFCFVKLFSIKKKQETLRVVTIAMICSTLASLWKFQYFRRPIYNPVEHLWWSFYWKNSKPFTKKLHRRCLLGF